MFGKLDARQSEWETEHLANQQYSSQNLPTISRNPNECANCAETVNFQTNRLCHTNPINIDEIPIRHPQINPYYDQFQNKFSYRTQYRQLRTKKYWKNRRAIKGIISETILTTDSVDKRPYVSVLLNNIPYTGLLDSGASISVLGAGSETFLLNSGIKFHSLPSVIHTASGQTQRVFGYVVAHIRYNDRTLPIRLYIVPSLQQPLYLGINFGISH